MTGYGAPKRTKLWYVYCQSLAQYPTVVIGNDWKAEWCASRGVANGRSRCEEEEWRQEERGGRGWSRKTACSHPVHKEESEFKKLKGESGISDTKSASVK